MKILNPQQAAEIKTTWTPSPFRAKLEALEPGAAILILKNEWPFASPPRAYVGQIMGPGKYTILQTSDKIAWLIKKL